MPNKTQTEVTQPPALIELEVFSFQCDDAGPYDFVLADAYRAHVAPLLTKVSDLEVLSADQALNLKRVKREYVALKAERDTLKARCEELEALLDTPHTAEWFEGVKLEAGHQIKRWGTEHDAGKAPADWFWLIGFLAQKAMSAQMAGNDEKARHHTISTGAAMLNWFRAIVGDNRAMRPGIDPSQNKAGPAAKDGAQ